MNKYKINLNNEEKIGFISSMATMLSAGISILEIVESLLEDSKGNQKKLLTTVKNDLIQGSRLSSSLEKFPNIFDKVTISIIKVSEEAGTLEKTLFDIKTKFENETEFKDKIKSALAYPVLILVVFSGIILLMLTFVLPKISVVFSRMKVNLPLPTKIMIWMSNTLLSNTIPIIILTIVSIIGLVFFYKKNQKALLNILFLLPVVSDLARSIDLTNFARITSMLLSSGIPITKALRLTQDVVVKKEMVIAAKHFTEVVQSGKRLSEGMKDHKKVIPVLMIKLIEAGEKSGTLDKAMMDISKNMDYQVSKTLKSVTTMLEPILMVFVGLLVGGMMMSIIAPMYSLMGQVIR